MNYSTSNCTVEWTACSHELGAFQVDSRAESSIWHWYQNNKGVRSAKTLCYGLFLRRNWYIFACNALKIEPSCCGVRCIFRALAKSEEHEFWGYHDFWALTGSVSRISPRSFAVREDGYRVRRDGWTAADQSDLLFCEGWTVNSTLRPVEQIQQRCQSSD